MKFSTIENKQMLWNILNEMTLEQNIYIKEIENLPDYFESVVQNISNIKKMDTIEKNKLLLQKCYEYIQFTITNKNENNETLQLEKRMREVSNEMMTTLKGYRPPEIDFSDPEDKTPKISSNTGAPHINIDMTSSISIPHESIMEKQEPIIEKRVTFKSNKHYNMKASHMTSNSILFQNLTLESIKILTILINDKKIIMGKDKFGKNKFRYIKNLPFVFCTVYINEIKNQEEIIFVNKTMSGSYVRFEPKVPLTVRKQIFKIELRLFDENKNELNMGMTIDKKNILNTNDNENLDKKYLYVKKMKGMEAGDIIEMNGQQQEILGLCKIEDNMMVEDSDEHNYAIIKGERRNFIYYGKMPIILFII